METLRKQNTNRFQAVNGAYMLFWIFVLGSIAGYVLEGLWSMIYWGRWTHHVGVVWGPFCTVYGAGAVVMYVVCSMLRTENKKPWEILLSRFIVCALAGSLVEYMTSFLQELSFGSISWDYSDQALNLGGRISVFMTIVWGTVGLFYMQVLFPAMRRLIAHIQGQSGYITTWLLIVFLSVDLAVSAAAVSRWRGRTMGETPETGVAEILDESFDDERMETLFPNMQFAQSGR